MGGTGQGEAARGLGAWHWGAGVSVHCGPQQRGPDASETGSEQSPAWLHSPQPGPASPGLDLAPQQTPRSSWKQTLPGLRKQEQPQRPDLLSQQHQVLGRAQNTRSLTRIIS